VQWCLLGALYEADIRLRLPSSKRRLTALNVAAIALFVACREVILDGDDDLSALVDQLSWAGDANAPAVAMCEAEIGKWIGIANDVWDATHGDVLEVLMLAERLLASIEEAVGDV
jgi:hypothetical protein